MDPKILDLTRADSRFAYEAYEFVCEAVGFTQDRLGRTDIEAGEDENHVSGEELLRGACAMAVRDFGMMAPTVFRHWGIRRTDDFGEIVFKLIEAGRLSRSDEDDPDDFHAVFDLDKALTEGFELTLSDRPRKGER
ncbi:hypothetical protein J0H58_05470 [bacterium]|nr:hypothetical protein [bacterium]